MPISQARMMALIEAALAFMRSRQTLTDNIDHWVGRAFAGEVPLADALAQISAAARHQPEGEHFQTIGAEQAHFARVGPKNIRDQQRRLAKAGALPDPHIRPATRAQVRAHMAAQTSALAQAEASPPEASFDLGEAAAFEGNIDYAAALFAPAAETHQGSNVAPPTQAELAEDDRLAAEAMAELAAMTKAPD